MATTITPADGSGLATQPVVAAVVLAFGFVLMGPWIRMMDESFSTYQQVYLRLLLAGLAAAVLFRKSLGASVWRSISGRDWTIYAVRAFFSYACGVGLFTVAVLNAKLSTVSFVSSLPVLGLMAWLLFRERMRPATLPFIGLSIVGLALLTGLRPGDVHLGVGELTAIGSLVGFNLGYLMARHHHPDFSNVQNTTILLLLGWIPLFVVAVALGEPLWPDHVSLVAWIGLIASALQNIVGLLLVNYVFTHLKAYVAGNILLLEGLFAVVLGFALYGEVPTIMEVVGGAVILACAAAVSIVDARASSTDTSVAAPRAD